MSAQAARERHRRVAEDLLDLLQVYSRRDLKPVEVNKLVRLALAIEEQLSDLLLSEAEQNHRLYIAGMND